ncbi:branched-chain amino acid transport system permease protein [Deinococcus metalli]|uniref:Branched-chain amino acid ABC transporter permease n=1 Tax=Deinococcus metalli TaxID=1141878 RepID=A0A7W8NR26_9DEIO|nr:branched-chain amino acid ABC transporter permease [Deinococcus metalli]MBB5375697.1 branched-chain amino acid transport system permease protein [Deinococcus metalli]GHF37702.1 branched-chain amino acid ABC transporter permease [Deinococcus metalli]
MQMFDPSIFPILAADGLTNGAVYALLALATVLVFAVTRIIYIPLGEYVVFGTLTLAALQTGQVPGTLTLLLTLLGLATVAQVAGQLRAGRARAGLLTLAAAVGMGLGLWLVLHALAPLRLGLWADCALTLLLVAPLGPLLYRVVYQPLQNATVLVLLIASVALHLVLSGLALVYFGPEGSRTPPFVEGQLRLGQVILSQQSLLVIAVSALLMLGLYVFFGRTMVGKALRATAVNRVGARLVGISPSSAGTLTFFLAALIGALSGMLIGPSVAMTYDSGFLIGLKGFVGAIIGGLVSFPLAAAGAVLVGLIESFASFSLSAWKEVIVFTLILPVLLWRSLVTRHVPEDEE